MAAARELLLSDITEMGPGFCVLAIEPGGAGRWQTVRPLPQRSMAWPAPFPHKRRDYVRAELFPFETDPPHFEDHQTGELRPTGRTATEADLVGGLRQAEMAASIPELFGASVQPSPHGGSAVWVKPSEAARSICGCVPRDIRFQIYTDEGQTRFRAQLSLESGETLRSLPFVDHDWNRFLRHLLGSATADEVRRKMNGPIRARLRESALLLTRIGLTRPWKEGVCWLMLDSLFPQPKVSWLKEDLERS